MERDDQIRQRAYEIWVAAGMPDDKADEHWAQAQAETGPTRGGDGSPKLGEINEADD